MFRSALLFLLLAAPLALASDRSSGATNGTFWLIPHTHWEGAVFKTREQYLEMGLPNILTALRLLKEHPVNRMTTEPPPPTWGKRKSTTSTSTSQDRKPGQKD